MKILYNIGAALVVMAVFAYLAYIMYDFDYLTGRQYRLVLLIAGFMVGIFGSTVAAIITGVLGLAAGVFIIFSKENDDKEDEVIPTKRL